MGSDLGDVNNDGLIDLLVADMATTTHLKDQNSIAQSREKVVEGDDSVVTPKYHRSALYLNTARVGASKPPTWPELPTPTGLGLRVLRTWTTTGGSTSL